MDINQSRYVYVNIYLLEPLKYQFKIQIMFMWCVCKCCTTGSCTLLVVNDYNWVFYGKKGDNFLYYQVVRKSSIIIKKNYDNDKIILIFKTHLKIIITASNSHSKAAGCLLLNLPFGAMSRQGQNIDIFFWKENRRWR